MLKFAKGSPVRLIGQLGIDLTGRAVNFVFSPNAVPAVVVDAEGYVINLAEQSTQTRAATVTDAAGGVVQYTLPDTDLATAGRYQGQFQFTDGSGALQIFPKVGSIELEALEVAPVPKFQ